VVRWWRPEQALFAGVRIDAGIDEGSEISPFYDGLMAKVIVHGSDRDDAIRRLRATLENAPLLGLRHNGQFLSDLLDHPAFRTSAMTTSLIDQWQDSGETLLQRPQPGASVWCLAAAAFALQNGAHWRADSVAAFDIALQCDGVSRTLRVEPDHTGRVKVTLQSQLRELTIVHFKDGELRFELDGVTRRAVVVRHQQELHMALDGACLVFTEVSPFPGKDTTLDATQARAPVAGKVTQIQVAQGDVVKAGQALLCIEAMKMEMWLTAQAPGRVAALHAKLGEQVASGNLLVEIELQDREVS
jgi:geranyl-CoA carboxylase alpha subunit